MTWWGRLPVILRDLPFALFLAAISFVPALHNRGTQLGDLPGRPFDALTVAVVALECLPLAVRRRWPAASVALVSLGFAIDQLRAYHLVAGTALAFALLSAGAHVPRRRRLVAALLTAAYVALAIQLDRLGSPEGVTGFGLFYVLLAAAWGVGVWLRQTRFAEAERRRHLAEATRAAERTRIARELHDVVTHHVTAMVVQAESARYLTAAPERLDQTLTAVTETGRRAIGDLRQMLDLLNPQHEIPPAVSRDVPPDVAPDVALHALVEQTRRAGQPVELVEEGGPVPATAYEIVREALTNALKHDHGGRTTVRLTYHPEGVAVEISSDGSGTDAASPGGSGRGLAGLRARVEELGGSFDAGPSPAGGFVVSARIPS